MVGDAVAFAIAVQFVQGFALLGEALTGPAEAEALEELPHGGFDKCDAPLDPAHSYLQVVHLAVIIGRRQVVGTERAQEESQEQV